MLYLDWVNHNNNNNVNIGRLCSYLFGNLWMTERERESTLESRVHTYIYTHGHIYDYLYTQEDLVSVCAIGIFFDISVYEVE